MVVVKVSVDAWLDAESFPGVVECHFVDAWGAKHVFQEKYPVVLGAHSTDICGVDLPLTGWIACEIMQRVTDGQGRVWVRVTTAKPWGIASIAGIYEFDVLNEELIELEGSQ